MWHANEWRDIMSYKANFEQAYPALPRRAPRPYRRAASRFPLGPEPRLAHGMFVELLGDHLQISAGLVTNTDLASDPSCEANDGPDLKEVWRTPRRAGIDGVKCRAVGVPLGPEPDGITSWLLLIRTMPSAHTECIGRSSLSSQNCGRCTRVMQRNASRWTAFARSASTCNCISIARRRVR
jgi:hypothetical protein